MDDVPTTQPPAVRRQTEPAILKHAAVQAGAVTLRSVPLQKFGEDGSLRDPDGLTEFERGLAEGERRAEERLRQERALFVQALRKLDEARTALQQTLEDDVVALAFHIATKVLHEAADTCKDQIIAQAKSAVAAVRESGAVVLQVHPADVPAVESARSELLQRPEAPVALQIVPLPSVPRGTCLVHTAHRTIDASLDSQLLRLGEALKNRGRRESR
jgi:flagellar biosynthesis/type III secretory pathway protein FliH